MNKLFFGLIPITVLSATSIGIIVLSFNPDKSEGIIKALFFASFAAFLWGCGAIVFFILNLFVHDRMGDALRRGFFVSALILALVFLNKNGLLFWYTGFGSAIVLMLLEFWIYKSGKITLEQQNG